jgi:FixJ family two-component response regulator
MTKLAPVNALMGPADDNAVEPAVVAVVDDDPRVLEALQDLLEAVGLNVRLYASAEALLESDGLVGIDCLITDIGLPIMDGSELKRVAKNERPELPVLLITGRHELAKRQLSRGQPPEELFRKPFASEELLAAVFRSIRRA